jgi:hypothetical protein
MSPLEEIPAVRGKAILAVIRITTAKKRVSVLFFFYRGAKLLRRGESNRLPYQRRGLRHVPVHPAVSAALRRAGSAESTTHTTTQFCRTPASGITKPFSVNFTPRPFQKPPTRHRLTMAGDWDFTSTESRTALLYRVFEENYLIFEGSYLDLSSVTVIAEKRFLSGRSGMGRKRRKRFCGQSKL